MRSMSSYIPGICLIQRDVIRMDGDSVIEIAGGRNIRLNCVQKIFAAIVRGRVVGSGPFMIDTCVYPCLRIMCYHRIMENPERLAKYVGVTEKEVKDLCKEYSRDFEECKAWYNGYYFPQCGAIYNPNSIVKAILLQRFDDYWNQTETYDALRIYIDMNFDGLKDSIIKLMAGERQVINTGSFQNDMTNFSNADDVMTLLIHLGYLGFDQKKRCAFIPNEEIRQELTTAVESTRWKELITFENESLFLLDATLDMENDIVAEMIGRIHDEYASGIQYNNENSLSSVLTIAYLGAMNYYFKPVRELPTGRGFADFVYIPKPEFAIDYPAMVVELKWNKTAKTAINQIREKQYMKSIEQYTGNILLVGISYDKKTKKHQCIIEEYMKK